MRPNSITLTLRGQIILNKTVRPLTPREVRHQRYLAGQEAVEGRNGYVFIGKTQTELNTSYSKVTKIIPIGDAVQDRNYKEWEKFADELKFDNAALKCEIQW